MSISYSGGSSEYLTNHENDFQFVYNELQDKVEALKSAQFAQQSPSEARAATSSIEDSIEEAYEILDRMGVEVQGIPTSQRSTYNTKIRGFRSDVDKLKRESQKLADSQSRAQLFGDREGANDSAGFSDEASSQRQQLLSSQQRLEQSSERLRDAQRVGNETEAIGAGILNDLHGQREQIINSRSTLTEADTYVDKSLRTLRGMARRMAANRLISYAIIAVLILLIVFVIASKFL